MKKKHILSAILFLMFYSANCYSQNWLWAKSAIGTIPDYGYSVSADAQGNVFVTGRFFSPTITFDTITLTNTDSSGNTEDIFIAKYDTSGNILWAKSQEEQMQM